MLHKKIFYSLLLLLPVSICAQTISIKDLGLAIPKNTTCTSVKNQDTTSTCWSFAGNSFLESELLKNGGSDSDLSEMFTVRYIWPIKIATYLANKGNSFLTAGGQFHDIMYVIKKFGMMPRSIYYGNILPKNFNYNQDELDTTLKLYAKELVSNGFTSLLPKHRYFIDSVLTAHLGIVPDSFFYQHKWYTPKSYANNILKLKLSDYVEITSYTNYPFYKKIIWADKYNWMQAGYYNLPIADLIAITDNALSKNYTVIWNGDTDEPTFEFENKSLAYLPKSIAAKDYQQIRQTTFLLGTTKLDHVMHVVATTKDTTKHNWYYIKNSWGSSSNFLQGFLFMSKDYFAIKTAAIVVNKNAIPLNILYKMQLLK